MPALEVDGTLIDAKLIKVSDGKLPLPQNLNVERMFDGSNAMMVSWQNDQHCNAERLKDEVWAMSYAEGKFSKIISTNLKRSDLQGSFTLPAKPVNATYVYLFMASENGEQYSESIAFQGELRSVIAF